MENLSEIFPWRFLKLWWGRRWQKKSKLSSSATEFADWVSCLVLKESWVLLERRTYKVAELKWRSCRAVRDLRASLSLSLHSAYHPLWKKKYREEEEEEEEGENTAQGKSQWRFPLHPPVILLAWFPASLSIFTSSSPPPRHAFIPPSTPPPFLACI